MDLHDRLAAVVELAELPTREARASYIEQVLFRLKLASKREPDLLALIPILESAAHAATTAAEPALTDDMFDRYFLATLQGLSANPAILQRQGEEGFMKVVLLFALDLSTNALELRKKVLHGNRTEGSVHDDQRRDDGGAA